MVAWSSSAEAFALFAASAAFSSAAHAASSRLGARAAAARFLNASGKRSFGA